MALISPGVQVSIIDESFYTPAEPGTVPMIFVASKENKTNASGTGIAPGTLKSNAGRPYLVTSQRDLSEIFGDPTFYTDSNNNPLHANELNEYGLQAAYSMLGVSNRAFVIRADVDLAALQPTATAPSADPRPGATWLDVSNSSWGIFEWTGGSQSQPGGQSFSVKTPLVITDANFLEGGTHSSSPIASLGSIGDYAVVATADLDPQTPVSSATVKMYFKSPGNDSGVSRGAWVLVGSEGWKSSWPVAASAANVSGWTTGLTMTINGQLITGASLAEIATSINNNLGMLGISARVSAGRLELFSKGVDVTVADTTQLASEIGLTVGTHPALRLAIDPHTTIPQWRASSNSPFVAPTGSVWVKTTQPNNGARWRTLRWNSQTSLWETIQSPIFKNNHQALYNLDRAGGGANLIVGEVYVQSNVSESTSNPQAEFKMYVRRASGPTTVTGTPIDPISLTQGTYSIEIQESKPGLEDLAEPITVTFTAQGAVSDSNEFVAAINAAGFNFVRAQVNSDNSVTILHTTGGDIRFNDQNTILSKIGISPFNINSTSGAITGDRNMHVDPTGANRFIASHWAVMVYEASESAPRSLTEDGTLWYSSIIDEVDIMINTGSKWVGYQHEHSPYYSQITTLRTDPNGPIISASEPETQSDGTALIEGDLWIDTSDIDNYPNMYRFNGLLKRWILIDKTDQTTGDGVIFADARYSTSGSSSDKPAPIRSLLVSDYVDTDAPDPKMYPQGMLLWNLRRSGFNVKRFVRNYIDVTLDNIRYNAESMSNYVPHRWVTESANQEDGSGSFGRKAQRKVIVQALQATVNSNQAIRDEESILFNLMATPGYPELIGEMITLNYDRNLTAFVIGDTPPRLRPESNTLNEWGMNMRQALEDNDLGLVSRDEYLGIYYPWGFTSDNAGNNVAVPPSHMMLRTIALSDQASYPWFAPAGIRRGGITNASSTGYVSSEGEFVGVTLNEGQRDTLYSFNVNPITFISGAGLVAYGQKTRARGSSSLDRVNVARLVIYLRTQLSRLAKPYIFEPNDKITRDQFKQVAESLCLELIAARAIGDYLVVCDESNNTRARIDRNEMYLDIAIEPIKSVEFIYIPVRLKNTGAISSS